MGPYVGSNHKVTNYGSARNSNAHSTKRIRTSKSRGHVGHQPMQDQINLYRGQVDTAGSRPYSAPKHSVKRQGSSKPRRAQSGRAKQVRQYLSEQEAAHIALQ